MTPDPERTYLVQILASVEVDAPDKRAATATDGGSIARYGVTRQGAGV